MIDITREEGERLVREKQAGWYAINANPPVPHPDQTVIYLGERTILAGKDEFSLKMGGTTVAFGVPKIAWLVECADEIGQLIMAESSEGIRLDQNAFYTGSQHPPTEA